MRLTSRTFVITGCLLCALLGAGAHTGHAQQGPGVIGSYYPTQLIPGQATTLHVALGRNNPVQSIEITPPAGITVTGMTSRDLNQGSVWWEFTVNVAKDAAPGPRSLVAVQQTGRTAPVTLTIPNHVPAIANLTVLSAQVNQPMVDVQFTASDQGGSFGASPYVWFLLSCGPGQPEAGGVRGRFDNGTIRVSIPNPRTLAGHAGAPAAGNHCDLQLRVTDSSGVDSNASSTSFDFK
jgi:hypothetical protein